MRPRWPPSATTDEPEMNMEMERRRLLVLLLVPALAGCPPGYLDPSFFRGARSPQPPTRSLPPMVTPVDSPAATPDLVVVREAPRDGGPPLIYPDASAAPPD